MIHNLTYAGEDVIEVVTLDDAIGIAQSLLSDAEYGYSFDDLYVEAGSFMRSKAFDAVAVHEDASNE